MDKEKEYDEVSGTLEHVTRKAILISTRDPSSKHWIPRLVIEDGDQYQEDDIGEDLEFMVESWFVDQEGL